MNGKQAKRLRRAAMGLAVTLEQSGRKVNKDGYAYEEHIVRSPVTRSCDYPVPDRVVVRTVHVDETTLKGIYKKFKKGVTGKIKP